MHELALAQGVVDIVEAQARAGAFARVLRIRLEIGGLAQVMPDALLFGFDAVSRGTIAEGATLEIERPPGLGQCLECGRVVELASRGEACPSCGGLDVLVTAGTELRVLDLEVE